MSRLGGHIQIKKLTLENPTSKACWPHSNLIGTAKNSLEGGTACN